MDKLYIETKSFLLQLNDFLVKFDQTNEENEIQFYKQTINEKFNQIKKCCDQLDIYVQKEPATRRYDSKMKVDQLKYDFQHYKASFNSMNYKK
jgi:Golgi SNAP receptor complex protein 2